MTAAGPVGFLGLGAIGGPMARNLAAGGFRVLGYDVAEPARWASAPIEPARSVAAVAQGTELVLMSLPDASAVRGALNEMLGTADRRVKAVIDLSTIGVTAAREFAARLDAAGIAYVDAPVSGGVSGARDRKLSVMCACPEHVFPAVKPVLDAFAGRVFHVGETPGQGQALKLLNNFLSASALAATSEAVLFGLANGLDMTTMIEVLKVSSGRNSAVDDKFPNHIASGRYDSGFRNNLMAKDVGLYAREAEQAGCHGEIGRLVERIWRAFGDASPGQDFTAIFEFVKQLQERTPRSGGRNRS